MAWRRPEDVIALAKFFVAHFNREFRRSYEGLSPTYPVPGPFAESVPGPAA